MSSSLNSLHAISGHSMHLGKKKKNTDGEKQIKLLDNYVPFQMCQQHILAKVKSNALPAH